MIRALSWSSILTAVGLSLANPPVVAAGGWLGATVEPPQGVQIAEIFRDSPADRSAVKRGDIVLRVDDIMIRSMDHFAETIAQMPAGKEVSLVILRRGETLELRVTLGNDEEHPSSFQSRSERGRTPVRSSFVPPPAPLPSADWEQRSQGGRPFPPEEWPDYHPPQERTYRPPLPSAWLGVAPGTASNGVAVLGVAPDSPAEHAELRVGDVIIAINRQAVGSPRELVQTIGMMQPGDLVELSMIRDGRTQMLQVQLQKPPATP